MLSFFFWPSFTSWLRLPFPFTTPFLFPSGRSWWINPVDGGCSRGWIHFAGYRLALWRIAVMPCGFLSFHESKDTPQSDSTRSWLAGSLSSFFFLQKNFLPSWTWTFTLKLVLYQYFFPFESLWNEIKAPNYSSFCYDAHLLVCLADLTTILNRLMKLNVLSTPYCVQWNKSLSSHADCDIFCVVNLVVYRYHSAVTKCGAQQGYGDEKCRKIKPGPVVMIFSAEA